MTSTKVAEIDLWASVNDGFDLRWFVVATVTSEKSKTDLWVLGPNME